MILAALALATAPPADTPRGFVAQTYAEYAKANFDPLARLDAIFAPELAAAIREDQRRSTDEPPYLNGDPLCDCQDFQRIAARITDYQRLTPALASVRVHVDLGQKQSRDLRLKLLRTPAGWRIGDVAGADGKSLLAGLKRANGGR